MEKKKKADIIFKINLLLFVLFYINGAINAQTKKDSLKNYTFEYLGGCDTHIVHRIFLTDSTFVEKTTITYSEGNYTVADTFMMGKSKWFYLQNNEWLPYFSKSKFIRRRKLCIFGDSNLQPGIIATPIEIDTIENREVYVYRLRSPNDIKANKTLYYFDLGVVKIIETGYDLGCREKISSLIKPR